MVWAVDGRMVGPRSVRCPGKPQGTRKINWNTRVLGQEWNLSLKGRRKRGIYKTPGPRSIFTVTSCSQTLADTCSENARMPGRKFPREGISLHEGADYSDRAARGDGHPPGGGLPGDQCRHTVQVRVRGFRAGVQAGEPLAVQAFAAE